jgi:hypothetical protein
MVQSSGCCAYVGTLKLAAYILNGEEMGNKFILFFAARVFADAGQLGAEHSDGVSTSIVRRAGENICKLQREFWIAGNLGGIR